MGEAGAQSSGRGSLAWEARDDRVDRFDAAGSDIVDVGDAGDAEPSLVQDLAAEGRALAVPGARGSCDRLERDVEAPDPRTLVVRWKRTYIDAPTLFTYALGVPLPRGLWMD